MWFGVKRRWWNVFFQRGMASQTLLESRWGNANSGRPGAGASGKPEK